ncbi:PREDICTED: EPM2A-interacting protein 1-like [Priapulus caudatus]|uniref:EPM2A-interacting protein 1-like n=1 Tax=Priapulus caudatus TaxID=37621 RepID=A0ABM1F5F9_PRICU|nr:PREDICTED: EPM2A-interacting protein 1-like [Priapulus caudatus]
MASKKRKVDSENRAFNEDWTRDYFFVENRGNIVCLICTETIAVAKVSNVKRHYMSKHSSKFDELQGEQRAVKVKELKGKLSSQQSVFTKSDGEFKKSTKASYVVSEIIAKRMKPFSDGEFVKECVNAVFDTMCPEKAPILNSLSLSARTVSTRIEELSKNLSDQLHSAASQFKVFSLAA